MAASNPKRLIVGASGASGTPLLVSCLEELAKKSDWETHLVMTKGARLTADYEVPGSLERITHLADYCYEPDDLGAAPASGSFPADGMLIVPCSMKTLAGIHAGYADNLLLRSADVCIKEQRTLVLAARETPLSAIHLRNMHELALIPGIHIVPPVMAFYDRPQSITDMVRFATAKVLAPFHIDIEGGPQWRGIPISQD